MQSDNPTFFSLSTSPSLFDGSSCLAGHSSPPSSQSQSDSFDNFSPPFNTFHPPSSPVLQASKAKRTQVKNACVNCQKACKKCDDGRPCTRCLRYNLASTCRNSTRKQRKRMGNRGKGRPEQQIKSTEQPSTQRAIQLTRESRPEQEWSLDPNRPRVVLDQQQKQQQTASFDPQRVSSIAAKLTEIVRIPTHHHWRTSSEFAVKELFFNSQFSSLHFVCSFFRSRQQLLTCSDSVATTGSMLQLLDHRQQQKMNCSIENDRKISNGHGLAIKSLVDLENDASRRPETLLRIPTPPMTPVQLQCCLDC